MAMDEKKRQRISFFGSIGFHIIVALIIGLTGLLSFTSLNKSDIFEVTPVADSGGGDDGSDGGASSSGGKENSSPKQVANSEQQAFTPEQIGSDAILEHSDTSPTKVTYDQLEQLQKTIPTDDENQKPVITPRPALDVKARLKNEGNGNNANSADSNSTGNGNNGDGNSNGNGTNGNGNGNSGGNGKGSGNGSGGNGNGSDMGEATNEVVNNPAQPPIPTRRVQPDYPSSARAAGISGTVRIRFLIGKDGSVESATISSSSGNADLDQAALNAAYGWRFIPAKDNLGRAVRCYAGVPITFDIR